MPRSPAREMATPEAHADIPFVTFTWSRDVHYAKALLGSIRHFYPDRRIIVVAERDLPHHDIVQIRRFPNTEVIPVMDLIRRHKFHFVGLLNKLNALFLPGVPRVIVADADGPGVDGAERIADAVLIMAPVRIITPGDGAKDARAWVVGGADRSVVDGVADAAPLRCLTIGGAI